MRKQFSGLMVGVASLMLGGCVTSTSMTDVGQAMKADPAVRAERIEACTRSNQPKGPAALEMSRWMKVKPGPEMGRILCTRIADGIISGKMTMEDYSTMLATRTMPPRMVRVFQGR